MARTATVSRDTKETTIKAEWNLDGSGLCEVTTGIRMLDHMIGQIAAHGRFDIKLSATGDDIHHVVEDCAITLGKALARALGGKGGIARMGSALVPMDDALAQVALDISGRPFCSVEATFTGTSIGALPTELVRHFLISLASEARMNLHARVLAGSDDHHKAEALFKALGRALDVATRVDDRLGGRVASTKEMLEQ
ncbi:MAG: imidazoleglycerol-phosphate dehydratase HisB [Chloroflexi bacterium]|nr:imidazoleglycerol-phosphate dehydratase HisB [Chloroflexota bacterium]